jgi:hypothetical protein
MASTWGSITRASGAEYAVSHTCGTPPLRAERSRIERRDTLGCEGCGSVLNVESSQNDAEGLAYFRKLYKAAQRRFSPFPRALVLSAIPPKDNGDSGRQQDQA